MTHTQPKLISQVTILRRLRELELIDADTFCEQLRCTGGVRWFGLDKLTEPERQSAKAKWGYRAKCTRLLAAVLRKPEKTVNNWGARFEWMPEDHQVTLTYAAFALTHLKGGVIVER